ncbi:MAG TPA: hypothetical protein VHC19_25450 [Pirellulales bacterium]|nr:hypothetical protein [Pirellulales bacterium]
MDHDPKSNRPYSSGQQAPTPEDFRQAIEVCRPSRFDPEGRDWQLPEVAPLADEIARQPQWTELRVRVAALDDALAGAMDQGPAPDGLAERLLKRLRQAELERTEQAATVLSPAAESSTKLAERATESPPVRVRLPLSRRRWQLGAALAAAAAVCIAAWWWTRPVQSISYEQLLASANAFDSTAAPDPWKSVAKSPPQRWYAVPSAVSVRTARRWKSVRGFVGRRGVAYELIAAAGAKGTLYVMPLSTGRSQSIAGLGHSPGLPQRTGGLATAAWTDGTRLYVLVVHGGEQEFWSFLGQSNLA